MPLRRLILTEMVARTFATRLRMLFRAEMRRSRLPGQARYKELLLDYLNSLLQSIRIGFQFEDAQDIPVEMFRSPAFWSQQVKYFVEKKFPNGLTAAEREPTFLLHVWSTINDTFAHASLLTDPMMMTMTKQQGIYLPSLLRLLCKRTGVKIDKRVFHELCHAPHNFRVQPFDIKSVRRARIRCIEWHYLDVAPSHRVSTNATLSCRLVPST